MRPISILVRGASWRLCYGPYCACLPGASAAVSFWGWRRGVKGPTQRARGFGGVGSPPLVAKIKRFFGEFCARLTSGSYVFLRKKCKSGLLSQNHHRRTADRKAPPDDGLSIGRLHCVAVLTAALYRHYYHLSLSLLCHVPLLSSL